MHVQVTGRNIDLTPALKHYLVDKLQRAQKHFDHDLECKARLSVARNPSIARCQTAEVTIKVNGQVIRGEESTENMYASIDLVADKIERQLRKYKTRYYQKGNKVRERHGPSPLDFDVSALPDSDEVVEQDMALEIDRPEIVRCKKFALKPMSPEEACKHMDLLGHDFFMFVNLETSKVCTVYHRRDGNYALIEPEY
ncbi:MAG: ribosome-associated translation inhibitor RaiA [Candidatus Obscuribacterales bacterium]|nr:ribosome-associated translation inhibitor RaiA [Candidatus Obscuribacterales bacterium]